MNYGHPGEQGATVQGTGIMSPRKGWIMATGREDRENLRERERYRMPVARLGWGEEKREEERKKNWESRG